jgi:hypothetical protein
MNRAVIEASREAKNVFLMGDALGSLGGLYLLTGEMDLSREYLLEAVNLVREKWNPLLIANTIYWLALYWFEQKQFRKFIQLNSFLGIEKSINMVLYILPPTIQTLFQRNVVAARAELSQEDCRTAELEGKTLTLDQALKYAVDGIDE